MSLSPSMPDDLLTVLTQCATDRDTVCTDRLFTDVSNGKHILNVVMNGGGLPPGMEKNEFLAGVQKLSRYLRSAGGLWVS